MKISLTSVYVDDPAKAFEFYTRILGFVEKMFVPEAGLAIVASPEEPEGVGLLLEPSENPIAGAYQRGIYTAGLPALVLGTGDIQDDFRRLTEKGVVFRTEPTKTEWGTAALFEDSCGNLLQLHQP